MHLPRFSGSASGASAHGTIVEVTASGENRPAPISSSTCGMIARAWHGPVAAIGIAVDVIDLARAQRDREAGGVQADADRPAADDQDGRAWTGGKEWTDRAPCVRDVVRDARDR